MIHKNHVASIGETTEKQSEDHPYSKHQHNFCGILESWSQFLSQNDKPLQVFQLHQGGEVFLLDH